MSPEIPDDDMIIRVDFGKKKKIDDKPSVATPFAGFSPKVHDMLVNAGIRLVAERFDIFRKERQGITRGKPYRDALYENQHLSKDELLAILEDGESQWHLHPQFYVAILSY